jgi:hypothetical protein
MTAWRSGKDSNPWYRSETCKSRRLRKLRGIKSFKNSLRLPASRGVVANRWGLQRSSKANPWRFCGRKWSLRKLLNRRLRWRVTACLAGSHDIETFSGGKNYLRRGFEIIFAFLARTFSAVTAPLRTSRAGQDQLPVCPSQKPTSGPIWFRSADVGRRGVGIQRKAYRNTLWARYSRFSNDGFAHASSGSRSGCPCNL